MPRPAHIGRKVRKAIVAEACLDIVPIAEGFWDCTKPKQLVDAQEKIADHVAFVRELDSGDLSNYETVDRARKLIEREQSAVRHTIGEAEIYLADEGRDGPTVVRRKAEIARHIKQGLRLRKAWLECCRWRAEFFEEQRDQEAVERVEAIQ